MDSNKYRLILRKYVDATDADLRLIIQELEYIERHHYCRNDGAWRALVLAKAARRRLEQR